MKKEIKDSSIEWTFEQKRDFVNRMESLPSEVDRYLKKFGIPRRKYNGWRTRYGVTVIYNPIVENLGRIDPKVLRFVGDGHKYFRNIEISVSIETADDIINVVNDLMKVKNIQSVTCIE
jgi:hypothetical protein